MTGQNELGKFLQERMRARGWGLNETARRAGISSAALSTVLRGMVTPRAETLKALAEALGLDEADLLYLAGHLAELPASDLDRSAAYIARRITALPNGVRERAIDMIGTQLDGIYDLIEDHPSSSQPPPTRLSDSGQPYLTSPRTPDPELLPPPEEIKDRLASGSGVDIQQLRQDLFLALKILSQEAPDVFLEIMDEFEAERGEED